MYVYNICIYVYVYNTYICMYIIYIHIYIYIYIYLCLHLLSFSELLIQTYSVSIFSTQLIWHFFWSSELRKNFQGMEK